MQRPSRHRRHPAGPPMKTTIPDSAPGPRVQPPQQCSAQGIVGIVVFLPPPRMEGEEILFHGNDGLSRPGGFPSLPGLTPPSLTRSLKIPAVPAREAGTLARTRAPAPRSPSPLPSHSALPLPSPPGRVGLGPPAPGNAPSGAGAVGAEEAESRGGGPRTASAFRSLSTRRCALRGGPRPARAAEVCASRLWRPCLPGDAVTDRAGGARASPRAPPDLRPRRRGHPPSGRGRGGEGGCGLPRRRAGLRGLGPCGRPASPASRRRLLPLRVPGLGLALTLPMSGRHPARGPGRGVRNVGGCGAHRGGLYNRGVAARRHMAAAKPFGVYSALAWLTVSGLFASSRHAPWDPVRLRAGRASAGGRRGAV